MVTITSQNDAIFLAKNGLVASKWEFVLPSLDFFLGGSQVF
jgi:hypothetical protein